MTIFVSIASYRDPELVPTLRDCIAKAKWPNDLRIGVCWQHDNDEKLLATKQVELIDVPYRESQGACWARAKIQRECFDNEDFYLQLDSHHRFIQDWDAVLIDQYERCGTVKAVLSTYTAAYTPEQPLREKEPPCMMRLDRIEPTGVVVFLGFPVTWATGEPPVRARFISGHFLFAPGRFVQDVPYDPDLFFTGEEISLAVRAFTNGYSLFHPSEHVIWHRYSRHGRAVFWDDHIAEKGDSLPWYVRDAASKAKVLNMLRGRDVGPLGLGTVLSLRDYEAYSGLNFTTWTGTQAAHCGERPTSVFTPVSENIVRMPRFRFHDQTL